MTFDDDFVRLLIKGETYSMRLVDLGLKWPPPERLRIKSPPFDEAEFQRLRISAMTDEQRAKATDVRRGAEYAHVLHSGNVIEVVKNNMPSGRKH